MTSRRGIAIFLALLGPLLMFGATAAGMHVLLDPSTAEGRLLTAGRVLNGQAVGGSVARAMERVLEEHKPDVVVIGNSIANRNFDHDVIAKKLSLPPHKVQALTVPGSVGSHFYAILKNRIYAKGHKVPLVLIIANGRTLLMNEPWSEASRIDLVIQLEKEEPVIWSKVSSASVRWQVTNAKRVLIRDTVLNRLRNGAISLFYDGGPNGMLNEQAMEEVFHQSRLDHGRRVNVMPIALDGALPDESELPTVEESFLPELAAMAARNGTKLVVVRSPQSPETPPEEQDIVPEDQLRAMHELLTAHGHTFVDMSETPVRASMFADSFHAEVEGSQTLAAMLGELLEEEVVFGPRGVHWFLRPPEPEITAPTYDTPPVDVVMGEPGRWLLPGDRFVAHFDTGWKAPPIYYQVHLVGEQFGPGARAELDVDGRRGFDLTSQGVEGRERVRSVIRHHPPKGPWTVTVTIPDDGAPTYISGLRIGRGPGARMLIGHIQAFLTTRYELLGQLELDEGDMVYRTAETRFDRPAPPVEGKGPTRFGDSDARGVFTAPTMRVLADKHTVDLTPLGLRCSPLRVLEDGVPLDHGETCALVMPSPAGRTCHAPERLIFGSTDGSPVESGKHTYTLALAEDRACWASRWLYPHDRMTVPVTDEVLARFRDGLRALSIRALRPLVRGTLTTRVFLDDTLLHTHTHEVKPRDPRAFEVELPRTVWPGDGQLTLELEGDDGYLLVTSLELVGRVPVAKKVGEPGEASGRPGR